MNTVLHHPGGSVAGACRLKLAVGENARASTRQNTRDKGTRTMEDARLRRTATYEAGHVVAHVRLGLEHRRVSLGPRGNGVHGTAGREGARPASDAARAKLVALAHCAGYAALIAAGYGEADALRGTGDDFREADELLQRWRLGGDIATWKAQAVELMRRPENVAAVAVVAQHLLERRKVDSDWVGCVLALLDGDMTETEFAGYVRFREALG
jgi:hypothetical protein